MHLVQELNVSTVGVLGRWRVIIVFHTYQGIFSQRGNMGISSSPHIEVLIVRKMWKRYSFNISFGENVSGWLVILCSIDNWLIDVYHGEVWCFNNEGFMAKPQILHFFGHFRMIMPPKPGFYSSNLFWHEVALTLPDTRGVISVAISFGFCKLFVISTGLAVGSISPPFDLYCPWFYKKTPEYFIHEKEK